MGTTAEKLAYLKETKNQIKQALETPSNVMRDYANWIKKYVDNQPTSTVTDGICTNALDVPLVSLGVDGNSYQGENPSPDNPQDIEVIDGVNLIVEMEEGTFSSSSGEKVGSNNSIRNKDMIKVKPNTNYIISPQNSYQCVVWEYDKNKKFLRIISDSWDTGKFTTDNDTYYINFREVTTDLSLDWQMVEGTTPKPYLPHGHIGLRQSGKNLIGLGTYFEGYVDSSAKKYIDMKSCDSYWFETKDLPDKIKISYKTGNRSNISYSNTKPQIGSLFELVNENSTVVNINRNYKYINIQTSYLLKSEEVQIEEGSTATPYEPYHSPKLYPINLNGNSIAKVGDVKDLLKVYRNGDVEIEKNINEIVLDSSYAFILASYNRLFLNKISSMIHNSKIISVNSNMFKGVAKIDLIKNDNSITNDYEDNERIVLRSTKYTSLNEYKIMLDEKRPKIYYGIEQPETIKLPSISPIELWEGTNKFELITNLDTTFEMEYVVNKDYLETQNLLNIVEGENI